MKKSLILLLLTGLSLSAWAIVPPRHMADSASYNRQVRLMKQAEEMAKAPMREQAVGTRKIFPRVPVILVNYPDMRYRVSRADIDSMFNGVHFTKDGATGSVRQYFHDQSYGVYSPQFDLYGPVTVSSNYSHYANHGSELVLEACALMNDSLDFTLYDTDGNNKVDLVYCLFAGPPSSDISYIDRTWISNPDKLLWPHYWVISSAGSYGRPTVFDGKTIEDYEISNELDGMLSNATTTAQAGIGVACHEFGHGMGLPDIYSTNEQKVHKTSGEWDIMDYGCYNHDAHTPPSYSAYERWFMGWLEPTLLNQAADVTLNEINARQCAAYMTENGSAITNIYNPNPSTYYLFENRQKAGWDAYLPGHGMLITKINYSSSSWTGNKVNVDANNLGIDILEADGLTPSQPANEAYGKPGDAYPAGSTSFTKITNYQVTDIEEANGVITFKVNGGLPTGIEETESTNTPRKILRDGRVVILRGEHEYDILGRVL